MSCANMKDVLDPAVKLKYAVAAYNIIDFGTSKALIEVAEELRAPVVMQVSVKTIKFWGYQEVASWYKFLAGKSTVPVVLHVDHCKDLEVLENCVKTGWTSIMIDASSLPFEENVRLSTEARRIADAGNVSLEAELGQIVGIEDDIFVEEDEEELADLERSLEFCSKVKPDLFAPAIGTAHGLYKGKPNVRYDTINKIHQQTGLPIALHGGTGLSDETFRKCISLGCAKINISTALKLRFIDSFLEFGNEHPNDKEPLSYIRQQYGLIKEDITRMITLFGGTGQY